MSQNCPLCGNLPKHLVSFRNREYYRCRYCFSAFADPKNLLVPEEEMARYLTHNNNVEDSGYRTFVSPIVEYVLSKFNSQHIGLDYGAGTGPVISHLLKEKGYNVVQFDPFFHYHPELLKCKYDYIICCEVMEHFYHPYEEFKKLRGILNPEGELVCMTEVYLDNTDFESWYYKNDPTHVFFYHPKAIEFIREKFKFSDAKISNRLIRFVV